MGQAIPFPTAPDYPDRTADLDHAECSLLVSIRWWVAAWRANEDAIPRLRRGLAAIGAADAAHSVDALMAIVVSTARQTIIVHCPRCTGLSDHEKHLLHAASLVQSGAGPRAARALAATLLSPDGADFALGPLAGLGALFAAAGLHFSRRRPPPLETPPIPWSEPRAAAVH